MNDPGVLAQALDARLARTAKDLRHLGHVAEATRVAAHAEVARIELQRRRLREIFDDLPEIDDEDAP